MRHSSFGRHCVHAALKSRRRRTHALLAASAAAVGLAGPGSAAVFTYTPTNSTTDVWSAGTDWNAVPASGATTELTFVGANSTVLAGGLANTNTDDLGGAFQLNILDLQGTGPSSGGAASITIAASGGNLDFIANGTTNPIVNLNANAGTSGLSYTISAPITLDATTTFQGSGTAGFNLTGLISGAGGMTFNMAGAGSLTLTQQNTFTGAVVVNGGTVFLNGANTGTGTMGNSSSVTVNNGGTISIVGGDNSFVGSGGFNGGRTITINAGGLVTSLATLSGHLGSLVLNGGTLATTGTPSGSPLTFGTFDFDHTVTAGGTATTSTISALDTALSQGGGTIFNVNPGASNGIDLNVTGTFFHGSGIGDNGLIKQGSGVMALANANTYTSNTTINAGTLLLDFTQATAPANNIINNGGDNSGLFLNGGTLAMHGSATTADSQQFNGLNVVSGNSAIALTSSGQPLLLTVGNVNRVGGTVDFTLPAGVQNATNGVVVGNVTTINGIIPWATVGRNNFASVNGTGDIVPFAGGFSNVPSGGLIPNAPTTNVQIVGGLPGAYTGLAAATTAVNSLLQSVPGVVTIDTTGKTLDVTSGGVVSAPGAGPLNIGTAVNAGSVTAGSGAAGELILTNNSSSPITVVSTIADNGSGSVALTASGTAQAPVILFGANTFTGDTSAGGLILANSLALQNSSLAAGSVTFSPLVASGNFTFGGIKGGFTQALPAGVTVTFGGNNQSNTFSGAITGAGGLVKVGNGTETFSSGNNNYTGGLVINSGMVVSTTSGGAAGLGAGPITVNAGATLQGNAQDSFGFTTLVAPTVININGGTVQENTGAFRITLPDITFSNGGTLFANGNTGDANGNFSFRGNPVTQAAGTNVANVTVLPSATTATVNAATIWLQAGTVNFNVGRGTAATDLLVTASLINGGGLTKLGNGIMTLTAASSYTGATAVNRGTLVLDFNAAGAPTSNIVGTGSAFLGLGGGKLLVNGNKSQAVQQQFPNGVQLTAGASTLAVASNGADVQVQMLGLTARSIGGTVDFVPAGASSSTNGINDELDGFSLDNGILGGFATVKGADWATIDANNNIVPFTAYNNVALGGTIPNDPTSNVQITGGTAGTVKLAAGSPGNTTSINSLVQRQTAATTIDTGGGTFSIGAALQGNLGAAGGVLAAPGTGALTLGVAPDSGALTSPVNAFSDGVTRGELIAINNSTNPLTINSTVVDNGSPTGLTASGSGTVVLLGTNTYTGQTSVNAGTLQVGNGGTTGQLGTGAVVDSAVLAFNRSNNLTVAGAISGVGTVVQNGAGAVTLSSNGTFTGGLTVNAGTVISGTSGGGSGLGNGPVTVNPGGTLQGNAGDSFGFFPNAAPQLINVNGGTVTEGAGAFRVTLPNFVFSNGGTLTNPIGASGNTGDANGNYSFFGVNGAASVTVNASASTALISATKIGVQNNLTLNVARGTAASDLTISSVLANFGGAHSITVKGNGITTFSGNNSYSGGLIINGGTVISTTGGGTGAGPVTVNAGATLQANGQDALTFSSPLTINGGTVTQGAGAFRDSLPNVVFGNGGSIVAPAGNTGDGAGNFSLFGGTVTVNASPNTANITGGNVSLQAANANPGSVTFNVNRGSAPADLVVSSVLQNFNANVNGVTLTGTGVTSFTNANTYTGPTAINGGTLLANNTTGSATGPSGAVSVNTGGTLAGAGSVGGTLAVNAGGTVSAGDAFKVPGTLTVAGATTFAAGSGTVGDAANGATYLWKINDVNGTAGGSTGWDKLALSALTVGGPGSFATIEPVSVGGGFVNQPIANFSPTSSYQWTIATLSGGGGGPALAAQFHLDTNALSAFASANNAPVSEFSVTSDANDVYIVFSPAPEPTSLCLLGLGAGGLLLRRRRRREPEGR